jgi:thiamine-phosphate pyrophosphorylase
MISDSARLAGGEAELVRRIAVVARAGVPLVQIREAALADGALVRLVAQAVDAVRATRARILVNERLDVAMAAGAHGVHLRADSVPASRIRAEGPPGFLVGRSVHSADEAAAASADGGVDYLLYGTVFTTASKPGVEPAGVEGLRRAVAAAGTVPVLAVGGVARANAPRLAASGCAGFAAIGLFADIREEELGALGLVVGGWWS